MPIKWLSMATIAMVGVAFASTSALAQKKYSTGATDTEIKLGNTVPYSGPASAYGTIGKAEVAYFAMINDQGGINGRKINVISLDDGYSPPKTVEQTRKLVEDDGVLAVFGSVGTPANTAVHKYFNAKKVPQLLLQTGATKWGDPAHFPWTMGWLPSYQTEAKIYVKYILENIPDAKIGILYQNDDFGKDYLKGIHDGLGDKAKTMIVKETSFETTDPTIDTQIVALHGANANVFFNITTPKFAAQAIKKIGDIGWKPTQFLVNVSNSVSSVLKPAGFEASKGVISTLFIKDASDPQWKDDAEVKDYLTWFAKYMPDANKADLFNVWGYSEAATLAQVLKQCGDDLTRENVMKQAANLKDFHPAMLLPGININTSPTDFYPIQQLQLEKFDGASWVPFGKVIEG